MTKKISKLSLNRETVRELNTRELEQAAGGQNSIACTQSLFPSKCCTGYYPSLNAPCTE